MSLYRIYTEDVNRQETKKLVGEYFLGATLVFGISLFEGKEKPSLIIELETDDFVGVGLLAQKIKKANVQKEVLLSHILSDLEVIL